MSEETSGPGLVFSTSGVILVDAFDALGELGPVAAKSCAEVETIGEGAAEELLEQFEVVLWFGGPVICYYGLDSAQREQDGLLHRLLAWDEVTGGDDVPVYQSLVTVHAIEDEHGPALREDGEICDESWWELVQ